MNRRALFEEIYGLREQPADLISAFNMLTNSATMVGFSKLLQGAPGVVRRARLQFGGYVSKTDARQFPTFSVVDDGSTGHGSIELFNFPRGAIIIWACLPNIPVSFSGTWTITTPVMSIGTVAAAADATLTSTEADVVGSTALTLTSQAGTFGASPLVSGKLPQLTDSTGGAASATLAAITAPAANATTSLTADMTAVKNAIAQFGKIFNGVPMPLLFDGTTTNGAAKKLFLNFAVNSDPTGNKVCTLGNSTTPGTVDLLWSPLGDF